MLDCTDNYVPGARYGTELSLQTLRYFNSELYYSDHEVGLLIKALQDKQEMSRQECDDTLKRKAAGRCALFPDPRPRGPPRRRCPGLRAGG